MKLKKYGIIITAVILIGFISVIMLSNYTNLIPRSMLPKQFTIAKGKLNDNMRPFYGTVEKNEENKIIVKNRDGNITVNLSSETKYTNGKKTDITENMIVSGVGTVNFDNSITATAIQINPRSPLNTNNQ